MTTTAMIQARNRGAGNDRRLSARHRCPQAERHRHDLRSARHPDHRPHPPAQAAGMRVLSFRHEQNAGYAASIAGFLTQKPGICLTVSAPGFLNGLNALAHATDELLPDDPHQRLERARDRRPAAGRLRGDGPARDRQAACQGRLPRAARRGHRRGHRARDPRRRLRPSGRRLPRPAREALRRRRIDAEAGQQVAHQGGRSGAAPDSRPTTPCKRAARPAEEREAAR